MGWGPSSKSVFGTNISSSSCCGCGWGWATVAAAKKSKQQKNSISSTRIRSSERESCEFMDQNRIEKIIMYRGRVVDLGITSNGGGVIRVMSGGRSMNQRLKKRSLQQVMQKKRKKKMEWNGRWTKKRKEKADWLSGFSSRPKNKNKK